MASVYNFDPTGTSGANRINNEQHVITAVNFRDYHYVIPKFAPFFENNFTIRIQFPDGATRTLIKGQDYYLSNQFIDASRACAKPIYGSISFLDTSLYGILSISYNTVGGIWNITPQEITRILAEELRNPRTTTWEQITYLPQRFPVIDHEWDLVDMTGAKDIVESVDGVRDAILAANGGGITSHVADMANPHSVTKAQVGLGNVQNYGIATVLQAQAGTANNAYMTPLRTADAINTLAGNLVNTHEVRKDNPHSVTKAQVGLGSVQNYPVATDTEARDGTATNRYMTPALTTAALESTRSDLTNHANNKLNPHNVTKDQVGLFNVENYKIATEQEARAGLLNDRYMTPLRSMQLCREFVANALGEHASRVDNPHQVSKDQVGLMYVQNYPIASSVEAKAGTANDRYMTPLRTVELCREFVTTQLDGHATLTNNPHGVTKAQVGLGSVQNYPVATTAEAQAGTAVDRYMTALMTSAAISAQALTPLNDHVTNQNNPHGVTKAQVGLGSVQNYAVATTAEAQSGIATNRYMTPLRVAEAIAALSVPATHMTDYNNPHRTTAEDVGAYSSAQVDLLLANYVGRGDLWVAGKSKAAFITEVLSGTAANADKVYGLNYAELTENLRQTYLLNFASTHHVFSKDKATTPDPVAVPYYWLELGRVRAIAKADTGSTMSIDITAPDTYWFVTGGHKQQATQATNLASGSPSYMLHIKNATAGGTHTLGVTRLTGSADSDVKFGRVFDTESNELVIYARVSYGYNDLQLTRITSVANDSFVDEVIPLDAEPAGITYATTVAYATTTTVTSLTNRVTTAEQGIATLNTAAQTAQQGIATLNSAMQTAQSDINNLESTVGTINQSITGINNTLSTITGTTIPNLDQRLVAIENLLNSITVG